MIEPDETRAVVRCRKTWFFMINGTRAIRVGAIPEPIPEVRR